MKYPLVKMINPHRDGCRAISCPVWKFPWAYFGSASKYQNTPDALYLDAIGRKTKHGSARWITAGCNSTECEGVFAVKESDLLAICNEALKRQ